MSQQVRGSPLTEELVELITGYDPQRDAQAFRACRDACKKNLKHQSFARTNQFQVQQSLDGLIERLSISNKDPLAEALDSRLNELRSRDDGRHRPEILSLLLNLADRPAELSRIEDLEKIRPRTPPTEKLTWKDIFGDANEDADTDSGKLEEEDDDLSIESGSIDERQSEESYDSPDTSVSLLEPSSVTAESLLADVDTTAIDRVKEAQNWRSPVTDGYAKSITELQAIREILHMLQGLPSTLFVKDESRPADVAGLVPNLDYYIESLSSTAFECTLLNLASVGRSLRQLDSYARNSPASSSSVLQTFVECIESRLRAFKSSIAAMESTLARPSGPTPVSIFSVQRLAESESDELLRLSEMTETFGNDELQVLELLYQEICDSQMTGDDAAFKTIGDTFPKCLMTYLRPLQVWMSRGNLPEQDTFIKRRDGHIELSDFWEKQFILQRGDEQPTAPVFLQSSVSTIFSLGKQLAFMTALGIPSSDEDTNSHPDTFLSQTLPTLLENAEQDPTPYSDRLSSTLNTWLDQYQSHSSSMVCHHLLHNLKLRSTLHALSHVYLSANSSIFQSFGDAIFARQDAGKRRWADPLAIEQAARSAFADLSCLNVRDIAAEASRMDRFAQNHQACGAKPLAQIKLHLSISPALSNIIHPSQIPTYQSASTLFLQLYRARSCLSLINTKRIPYPTSTLPLRQRLVHLVNVIQSHILHASIAPISEVLMQSMQRAGGVDEMVGAHAAFVAQLERCCLLRRQTESVHKAVVAVCDLAVFLADACRQEPSDQAQEFETSDSSDDDDDETPSASGKRELREENVDLKKLQQYLRQFEYLQGLIIAGLRTASRDDAGAQGVEADDGEARGVGMLAEELEASVASRRQRGGL